MDLSATKTHGYKALFALGALMSLAGTAHATLLTTTAASVSCNELTGVATAGTITVTPTTALTGSNTIVVGFPASPGGGLTVALTSASLTLTSSTAATPHTSVTFSVTPATGCAGVVAAPATTPVQFTAGGVNDSTSLVTDNVTLPQLQVTNSTVACSQLTGIATPGTITVKPYTSLTGSATITVGFPASPGGGLTLANMGATLVLSTANQAAGIVFSVTPATGCAGVVASPATTLVQFTAGGNNDAKSTVTDNVTPAILSASAPGTLSCSTATGPGTPITFTIAPTTAIGSSGSPIVVTFTAPNYVQVSPSGSQTFSFASQAPVTYTVSMLPGCANALSSTTAAAIQFKQGGTNDIDVSVPISMNATVSALVAPPVVLYCTYTPAAGQVAASWVRGAAQTVSVTSAASGGTPFTINAASVPSNPAWLNVSSLAGGTASSTPVTFTVQANVGCNSFTSNQTATLSLTNAPAPARTVTVTLQIVSATSLTSLPASGSISYVKGSGTPGFADILIKAASGSPFFTINTATMPVWLTSDSTTGTATAAGKNVRFSSTPVCDTLAPGTYNTVVSINVTGQAPFGLPISLQINNKAATLSVQEGVQRNYNWTIGNPVPSYYITAISSDSPIPYTVSTGGLLQPAVSASQQAGLAYDFGTEIAVNFNPQVFASAQAGQLLTGTVTLTWGTPASTIVVSFNITAQSPAATLTGASPATLPTAAPGTQFTVYLLGTGFVGGTDPTQATKVGILQNGVGSMIQDTAITSSVQNSNNMQLVITVPASDPLLTQFASNSNGTITIGICNPGGNATCTTPTGTAVINIGSGPIIQAVTSASSFQQVTPPALPVVSPYDMITIWGANFCASGATGAGYVNCSTNQILYGYPSTGSLVYPSSLTPDTGASPRLLTVTFQTTGSTPTVIGTAPLLIATNSQINAMVPAGVSAYITTNPVTTIDIVVGFGTGNNSIPFPVNVVATDPGIFTVGADGQGTGAILEAGTYAQVTQANPAGARATGAVASDTVQLYMTGLGLPTSTASDAAAGSYRYPTDCVAATGSNSYLAALQGTYPSLTTIDGAIIQSSLLDTGLFAPCVKGTDLPTVNIGSVSGIAVGYAGFVANSVAGLYQVNVQIPTPSALGITSATQLPISVTSNGVTSQTGVSIWVVPALGVTGPTGNGLTGTVGVPWIQTNAVITATQGTGPYTYAITSGLLPTGLSLVPSGSTVIIEGTPAAGTAGQYVVTVTATDSTANVPLTGSVTFTLTVAGGLYLSATGTAPYTSTFGTAVSPVTTVSATGGVYPYTYAITSPTSANLPVGMAINANTGVLSVNQLTPDGTYNVTVTATDASGNLVTGTGSITFSVVIAPQISQVYANTPTYTSGQADTDISTVTATGPNGSSFTYALASGTPNWVTLVNNVVGVTTGAPSGSSITVTVVATDSTVPAGAASGGTASIAVTVADH